MGKLFLRLPTRESYSRLPVRADNPAAVIKKFSCKPKVHLRMVFRPRKLDFPFRNRQSKVPRAEANIDHPDSLPPSKDLLPSQVTAVIFHPICGSLVPEPPVLFAQEVIFGNNYGKNVSRKALNSICICSSRRRAQFLRWVRGLCEELFIAKSVSKKT